MENADILGEMTDRSREVFQRIVEGYLITGDPVGSRSLTREMSEKVSAATIRNVMQDLEFLGLLGSPHVSAGRIPTQQGLRLFVDGMLEVSDLNEADRTRIESTVGGGQPDVSAMLNAMAEGVTISELQARITAEIKARRQELDTLAKTMVEAGVAVWQNEGERNERLIVRGRSNLIAEDDAEDLGRRAHFYWLREQTLFTFGFLFGCKSLYER